MPRNEYGLKHQETNLKNVIHPKAISQNFKLNYWKDATLNLNLNLDQFQVQTTRFTYFPTICYMSNEWKNRKQI